ncbi:DegV family protein [Legionella yabuuchiae]|uniref:DegV family protein n=1 Tax=Legionella yabuuchiae TaxID=376727 RepID=UPI00105659E5|nr:DegV family protein [Legionella yabuuchiae]
MPLSCLSAKQLHGAILNGCQSIIAQQELLNKINIFPVPDGDTGSNLSSTAKAVMQYSHPAPAIKETLQSVAEASIIGARGNSGMIFSQFLNGLYEHLSDSVEVSLRDFSQQLKQAVISVRSAISKPVDGTMLTIMEAWAELVSQTAAQVSCYRDIMQAILPALEQTVENTKEKLAVLKQSNVVDAGALGFYHFVKGFASYLYAPDQVKTITIASASSESRHHHEVPTTPPTHRYCTEGVLRGEAIDKANLNEILSKLGESIVISGSKSLCRFHVHTNTPQNVYSQLLTLGTLQYPKIDDMLRQSQTVHQRKHSIALVMDSCSDLPQSIIDHHQIHVFPINLHLDSHDLLDGYSFNPDEFYQTLADLKQYPQTSLPSKAMIEAKLAHLSEHYEEVLVISVSEALSGTCDVIRSSAQKHANVHVINSKNSTGGQGLLVRYAAELIEQGLDIAMILSALDKAIDNAKIFVAIDQFDSLIRSGRISYLKGRFAQLTGIKPIISIDEQGKGIVYSKALNSQKALSKLITCAQEFIERKALKLRDYCVSHAGVSEKAEAFATLTTEAFGKPPVFIEHVSTAIGLHAGYNAIGLAVLME